MNNYQKMMIRAVQALNVLKRLASQSDWDRVVEMLEDQAIALAKKKGML